MDWLKGFLEPELIWFLIGLLLLLAEFAVPGLVVPELVVPGLAVPGLAVPGLVVPGLVGSVSVRHRLPGLTWWPKP